MHETGIGKAPVLELQNIKMQFGGVTAVENFSLDIKAGEVVALVGDNGAGKSTTIKMLLGLLDVACVC